MTPGMPLFVRLMGQIPSGKNQIKIAFIRGRMMRYPEPKFKAWRLKAYQELQNHRRGYPILRDQAKVTVKYWPGDLIRRDVPGMIDALCHLLEWCPVHGKKKDPNCQLPAIADDSLLAHWYWRTMELDRENPRIEFTIERGD